ncbi:MAG TPA: vitamin K epoxide reductase family protein [Aggregatilineales bacterium]|nr:vitamin K epoxide reductase family protein [Aggregatilineales bacterium]
MATSNTVPDVSASSGRSLFTLRNISLMLVVLGLLISGYLSYTKLAGGELLCVEGESWNCDVVQNSVYADMFGIPVAYLGFATYALIGVLLLFQNSIGFLRDYGTVMLFGVVLFAFAFSMYLVYVQAAILGAWCVWCLAHEAIMTALFVVTGVRLYRELRGA